MQISLPTWPSALTTTKLSAKKISGQPDLPWSSCSVPISFSMGDWTAQQASPSTAPDRLPRSPLGRYHPSLQSRTALRQLHSFGPRLPMRSGDGRLTLRPFGAFQFAFQVGRHLIEALPVCRGIHGCREAPRAGDLLQQKLLTARRGVILVRCPVPQTMRNARVCYRRGN
jgi:hypothetical protein